MLRSTGLLDRAAAGSSQSVVAAADSPANSLRGEYPTKKSPGVKDLELTAADEPKGATPPSSRPSSARPTPPSSRPSAKAHPTPPVQNSLRNLDPVDAEAFRRVAARVADARSDPKDIFYARPEIRGYGFVDVALRIRGALAAAGAPRAQFRCLAEDFDRLVMDSMSEQRGEWAGGAAFVALGADDLVPLKHVVWAYVLAGGRVDVAAIADAVEGAGVLRTSDDVAVHVYTTHLLVAAKVSERLAAWGLLDADDPRSPGLQTTTSTSLRASAERIITNSLRAEPEPEPEPAAAGCLPRCFRLCRRPAPVVPDG